MIIVVNELIKKPKIMTVKHILIILFLLSNWYTVFTMDTEAWKGLEVIWYTLSVVSCVFQVFTGIAALFVLINESKTWEKINDWLDEPIIFKNKNHK